jgi:hypothetical protein
MYANDDCWLPPGFVVGKLEVEHSAVPGVTRYQVDGIGVDHTTITAVPDPTPALLKLLKAKGAEWGRQDHALAKKRARYDDGLRETTIDKDFGVHMVREDYSETFGAFCDEMTEENQRLTADRRAEVANLVTQLGTQDGAQLQVQSRRPRQPRSKPNRP